MQGLQVSTPISTESSTVQYGSNGGNVLRCPHVTVAGADEVLKFTFSFGFNLNFILIHFSFQSYSHRSLVANVLDVTNIESSKKWKSLL